MLLSLIVEKLRGWGSGSFGMELWIFRTGVGLTYEMKT
jgi:hypothetical protein